MSLEIQISSTTNFFYKSSAFWNFVFFEIMLESFGCGLYTSAAYTRVFTVNSPLWTETKIPLRDEYVNAGAEGGTG